MLSTNEYPRRILVAVSGLSPQIVTETLYSLAVASTCPFVPTEMHLITTSGGAEKARLGLLSGDPGWFHRLCKDYSLPPIRFDADTIHTLTDAIGKPLDAKVDRKQQQARERELESLSSNLRHIEAFKTACAAADAVEEWLPKIVKVEPKTEFKKLKLKALRTS